MPDDDKAPAPSPPPEKPAPPEPPSQSRPEPVKDPIMIGASQDPDKRRTNLDEGKKE